MNKNIKLVKSLNSYMYWPLYFLLLFVCMDVCIYFVKPKVAYAAFAFTAIYTILLLLLYFRKSKRLDRDLAEFGFRFNQVQRKMLLDLKVPYAMLDKKGFILWANDEFCRLTGMYPRHYYEVKQFFPNVTAQELASFSDEKELFCDTGESRFRILLKNVALEEQEEGENAGEGEIIAIYLYDETEIRRLSKESDERCMTVGLLYVDNYDDALAGISELNKSLLPALVERKIDQYMGSIDAVVQKIEKDKFLLMFQHKYLNQMKADRFRIVEEVRSLHIGNRLDITISIGIGICDEKEYSFQKAFDAAKAAVNRAAERGGDQVVLWGDRTSKGDAEGYTYLGGKTESLEKRSKVRSRVKTEAICEQIRNAGNVLIMGHKKGDADSFGASIGMYRIARVLTDRVNIVLDEVLKTVAMIHEQFKNSPSYEEGMFINNVEAVKRVDKGTLVIVVDVNSGARTECPAILAEAGEIAVIDHHREQNPIGAKVTYAETYASSTCELVTEMIQFVEKNEKWLQAERAIRISPNDADTMYAGILLDTNSFITKTGVRTFEAATYLKRKGADMVRVRKCFRQDKTIAYEKARIVNSADIFMEIYGFVINDYDYGEESPTEIGAQIANDLLDISEVKASFVFTEYQGVIYISARAMDEVNVELIMNRCGGGGHLGIAGAQYRDCTVWEAARRVKDVIRQMTEKGELG